MDIGDGAYRKVYVDAASSDGVQSLLTEMFGGRFRVGVMELDGYTVEVHRNGSALGRGDDFVDWPLLVEFGAEEERAARATSETTSDDRGRGDAADSRRGSRWQRR